MAAIAIVTVIAVTIAVIAPFYKIDIPKPPKGSPPGTLNPGYPGPNPPYRPPIRSQVPPTCGR